MSKQNGSLFRKWKKEEKKEIVINTPFKYKDKNKNKRDIHFAYQRTIQ